MTDPTPLSPVAQAVMDGLWDADLICCQSIEDILRRLAAAAFRAAAEEVAPFPGRYPINEYMEGFRDAKQSVHHQLNAIAAELERQILVPEVRSEQPWEREGWCDELGRCWWGRPDTGDWSADWTLATPEAIAEFCEFLPQTVCLPAHALPLPEVDNG